MSRPFFCCAWPVPFFCAASCSEQVLSTLESLRNEDARARAHSTSVLIDWCNIETLWTHGLSDQYSLAIYSKSGALVCMLCCWHLLTVVPDSQSITFWYKRADLEQNSHLWRRYTSARVGPRSFNVGGLRKGTSEHSARIFAQVADL